MKCKVNTNISLKLAKSKTDLKSCQSNRFVSDPSSGAVATFLTSGSILIETANYW